ncbi:hypothetical protein DMENIID0001_079220 [Sergentomyia squamirostris]
MNLSFAGGGFQGVYYCGVVACLKKCAPHLTYGKIYGTSAGALAAVALLIDRLNDDFLAEILRMASVAERSVLGPLKHIFNSSDQIYRMLDKCLPIDAHVQVNGRLCISLTTFTEAQNVIVSHFESRLQLIQALVCSCFIPLVSGIMPPYFNGVRYMDGELSSRRPYDDNSQKTAAEMVTVSAFAGESDICPCDGGQQIFHMNWGNNILSLSKENIKRLSGILIPPSTETLVKICEQGFYDTLKYLYTHNYISGLRCLCLSSMYQVMQSKELLQATMDAHHGAGATTQLMRKILTEKPSIENSQAQIVSVVNGEQEIEYLDLNFVDTTSEDASISSNNGIMSEDEDAKPASPGSLENYSLKHCFKLLPTAFTATRKILTSTILKRLHSLLYTTTTQTCTALQGRYSKCEKESEQHCSQRKRRHSDEKILSVLHHSEEEIRGVEPLLSMLYINKANQIAQTAIFNLDDLDTNIVPQTCAEIEINHQLEFDFNDYNDAFEAGDIFSEDEMEETFGWSNCNQSSGVNFNNNSSESDAESSSEYTISDDASEALSNNVCSALSLSCSIEVDRIC